MENLQKILKPDRLPDLYSSIISVGETKHQVQLLNDLMHRETCFTAGVYSSAW